MNINISLLALSLISATSFADPKSIILGQSAPFSGPSGQFGRQMWLGAQTYFDEVNRHGGVQGRKITVEALDDKYDVDLAQKNTQQLLKNPELFALFGYVGTPTLLKALPEVQKSREQGSDLFVFSNRSGAAQQRTSPLNSFVYNIRPSYGEETEALANYLVTQNRKKIAIFMQDDSYGESGRDGLRKALEKRGLSIVFETKYKRGAAVLESMKTQAEQIANNGADAVVCIASYGAAAGFIRDLRNLDFKGPIANISFVGSSDMLELLKSEGQKSKKDYSVDLINSQVVPPVSDTSVALVKEYVSLTEKYPVQIPETIANHETIRKLSFTGLEGFLNAKAFVEVLRKAKAPLTASSFRKVTEGSLRLSIGLNETLDFSKGSTQALHQVYLTRVVDGKFVVIKK